MKRLSRTLMLVAATAALALATADFAEARAGRGGSFGSRGTRTFQAPSATQTAPRAAAPIQRSTTQPGVAGAAQRGSTAAQPGRGMFGGGFAGGLLGGLVGAGLFGMLFGHGMFGGLGGLSSILGLLLQIGIIVVIARLAIGWFRRRQQPAFAGPAGGQAASRDALGGFGFGGGASSRPATPVARDVPITVADQDLFEKALVDIQTAYGREDLSVLRSKVTPELLTIFAEDLADNASRGVINETSDVKLLQGDLSESWQENGADYATVAMRFDMRDVTRDRTTGAVVDGDENERSEATEVWTFRRVPGGSWMLSAIQQA